MYVPQSPPSYPNQQFYLTHPISVPDYNFNPAFSYGQPGVSLTPGVIDQHGRIDQSKDDENKRINLNRNYLQSPLSFIRILLILSLIATMIASALVANRDWAVRQESSYNVSVWLTTLIFSCIELALSLIIFFINIINVPNLPGCNPRMCNIIIAFSDLFWFPAMIVLGAFCAKREAVTEDLGIDFRNVSLNRGAFGVTSAFSLLTGLLFLVSALIGFGS